MESITLHGAPVSLRRPNPTVDDMDAFDRALSAKLSTLGDLGPVRLEVSDDAITVLVDGRQWRAASTGRRIVADAWLRCALRKAVGMDWLPVVVDEAQSVGGMPIPTPVPGWILRTTASGSLQAVARG